MIWKHSQNHKLIQLIKIPPYGNSYKYSFTKFTDIVNSITTLSKPPTWIHSIILNTICKTKSISCKKNTELPIFSIKHKYFQKYWNLDYENQCKISISTKVLTWWPSNKTDNIPQYSQMTNSWYKLYLHNQFI